jgi:hypothetical protein
MSNRSELVTAQRYDDFVTACGRDRCGAVWSFGGAVWSFGGAVWSFGGAVWSFSRIKWRGFRAI